MSKLKYCCALMMMAIITACSSENSPKPEEPKNETMLFHGWNDSTGRPTEWWLGEIVRVEFNADKTCKSFMHDTLKKVPDNYPYDLFKFIYENGRLSKLRRWDVYYNLEYERSVVHYNPDGKIREIDEYQPEMNGTTKKISQIKYQYHASGKVSKMESYYQGTLGATREFEWTGGDVTEMRYTTGYSTGSFTYITRYYYDAEPSPEHMLVGKMMPIMRYYHYEGEYYMMSEHRISKAVVSIGGPYEHTLTYTYTQDEKGRPQFRFTRSSFGSGPKPEWDSKRVYLYQLADN